jgi:hypothetical protein
LRRRCRRSRCRRRDLRIRRRRWWRWRRRRCLEGLRLRRLGYRRRRRRDFLGRSWHVCRRRSPHRGLGWTLKHHRHRGLRWAFVFRREPRQAQHQCQHHSQMQRRRRDQPGPQTRRTHAQLSSAGPIGASEDPLQHAVVIPIGADRGWAWPRRVVPPRPVPRTPAAPGPRGRSQTVQTQAAQTRTAQRCGRRQARQFARPATLPW